MESTQVELPPPPGVINSIKAGFDAIAAHITAILLPLLLNLFLWLGPRLRVDTLFNSAKEYMVGVWSAGGIPAEEIQRSIETLEKGIPAINIFWSLRTFPIGISSLLFSREVTQTPLGNPATFQVDGFSLAGWILGLSIIGWVGGGLYFRSVARISAVDKDELISPIRAVFQTILLSIACTIIFYVIGLPLVILMTVLLQISVFIANIAVLILSLISMWVIVPVFFWPHGVFLKKQNFLLSIISSIQMARFTLPTSSMFVLTVFLLSVGLNYLWRIPPEDSWMTLFGIFGHSFVTTALLAASFIYYRDMNIWLQNVIERLKLNSLKRA